MKGIQMLRPEAGAATFTSELPIPVPEPGEVLVRVARTAICGTDRHIFHWDDSVSGMLSPPVIIGHEFCGYIHQLGDGVSDWSVGDYVSAEMHLVCNECRACRASNQHICEKTRIKGLHENGCFTEFVALPASNLVRLNPEYVPEEIGAFLDALGNAVHTVQAATSIAGRHVLVSGYGAIGAMSAAVVEFEGAASLTIAEVAPGHLKRAQEWASQLSGRVPVKIVNPVDGGFVDVVRDFTSGGVDVVLEMSGAKSAINSALELLYPGGEMIMLGIPNGQELTLEGFSRNVIFKGLTLRGVLGRRFFATWAEMLSMLARGLDVRHIVTHRLPLSQFAEGIALLDAGEAHKVVLDPSAG